MIGASHSSSCSGCGVGYVAAGAGSFVCTKCAPNTYSSIVGGSSCQNCVSGQYSNQVRTACQPCSAGQYIRLNLNCVKCPLGQYAASAQHDHCRQCDAGFQTNQPRTACNPCPVGLWSHVNSSNCSIAAHGYYLSDPDPMSLTVLNCPIGASCKGGTSAPMPKANWWVDRSSYGYANFV